METVVYLGLVAVIMPIVATLMFFSVDVKARGESVNVVVLEGRRISEVISRAINGANSVNVPELGSASSTLSLAMGDSFKNPTIFKLENGYIIMKEGTMAPVPLTSNRITVANLLFANVSQVGTPGSVRATFALSAGRFSRKFYVTSSLRYNLQ